MKTSLATVTRNTLSQHAFNLVKSAIVAILDGDRKPNDVDVAQLLSLAYDFDAEKTVDAFGEITKDKHLHTRRKLLAYIARQLANYNKDIGSDINDNIKVVLDLILDRLSEQELEEQEKKLKKL